MYTVEGRGRDGNRGQQYGRGRSQATGATQQKSSRGDSYGVLKSRSRVDSDGYEKRTRVDVSRESDNEREGRETDLRLQVCRENR